MKTITILLLLLGAMGVTLPAHAQKKPVRKASIRIVDPAKYASTGYDLKALTALESNLRTSAGKSGKRHRPAGKELTPYAQAVLNDELLRNEPAKSNENGVF